MYLIGIIKSYIIAFKRYVSKVNGNVFIKHGNQVVGWAYQLRSNKIVTVRLYVNSKYIGKQRANLHYEDYTLQKLNVNHNCGFIFNIPFQLKAGDVIDIRAGFFRSSIEDSPKTIPVFSDHYKLLEHFSKQEYKKPKVFFLHIPKTAGTSFFSMLKKVFPSSGHLPDNNIFIQNLGYPHYYYPFELSIEQIEKSTFLYGHYSYIFKYLFGKNVQVITFLRDPVKRTISNLRHMQQKHKVYKNWTLAEIYKVNYRSLDNMQIRHFCDNNMHAVNIKNAEFVNAQTYEIAKENLRSCFFVGITEYFDESIHLLEKKWDIKFNKKIVKNVAKRKTNINDELIEQIKTNNTFDILFYKFGKDLFIRDCENYNINIES